MDVDVALTYLDFVEERHRIWVQRQAGLPGPWTDDPILRARKFTNVYRVLDPGTQFVLEHLADPKLTVRDALMRCFLYRHTNLPSAWIAFAEEFGGMPDTEHLDELEEFWRDYRASGGKLFSGAYMIYPQSSERGTDKLTSIIGLTARLFCAERFSDDVIPDWLAAKTQSQRFGVLRRNKGVADFMSMQILTDFGYLPQAGEDRENEFVVPGPGAKRGAAALDPTAPPMKVLEWARHAVLQMPNCPKLQLPNGRLREPSLMDIQNTLCEFSKYVRYERNAPATKEYRPAHPGPQDLPVLPEHW